MISKNKSQVGEHILGEINHSDLERERQCACVLMTLVVSDSVIPWTVALQAPLSMELLRQEYWNGLP